MKRKINEKVTWVGKIDWELKFMGMNIQHTGALLIIPT